jgi:hypothetical protein
MQLRAVGVPRGRVLPAGVAGLFRRVQGKTFMWPEAGQASRCTSVVPGETPVPCEVETIE